DSRLEKSPSRLTRTTFLAADFFSDLLSGSCALADVSRRHACGHAEQNLQAQAYPDRGATAIRLASSWS
ncbi:hypothetical protein, partial [Puniceibacterium confluentis]|uniref:hypothetical protein n=1 Tax=Puniceibacterium confluentis TaxID=1958944 RepID=UPI001C971058